MARPSGFAASVRARREAEHQEVARHRAESQTARALERARKAYARAQREEEREKSRLYAESRAAEVAEENQQLEHRLSDLHGLLSRALDVDSFLDLDTLRHELVLPTFDAKGLDVPEAPADLGSYLPKAPSFLAKLWPGVGANHERQVTAGRAKYEQDERSRAERGVAREQALSQARAEYHRQVLAAEDEHTVQQASLEELKRQFAVGEPKAVVEYFPLVLEASSYPGDFPRRAKIAYVPDSKQLVAEFDLPSFDLVPRVDSYRYVKARDEITVTTRSLAQRKALYVSVISQITVRTLHELFEADRTGYIDSVVLNGYVEAIDAGTGNSVRPCIVTVRTTRDAFVRLNLRQVDPAACLRTLNAGVSRSPAELAAVRPVLEFSMVDPRFVQESDVLSTLDQRPNLMELTPGEFESLITNLFEKMGLETRLTQASRDGGVDCVAYDPRPIFGGKVVIQAKRYKHTVGVSAVRDLYGTLQNEGASKGILVTTSGYGQASIDFANGKPIELLSGENLLYLLKENAGLDAKIEVPPTWMDPVPDRTDS